MGLVEVQPGGWLWVKGDVWLPGEVLSQSAGQLSIKLDGDEVIKVPSSDLKTENYAVMHGSSVRGVPDMASLGDLHEGAILYNLKQRYFNNKIYTYIGSILVAVNPYKPISGLYSNENLEKYSNAFLGEHDPHIYAIANEAFRNIWKSGESQCVLISGESGAGKTESTKMILDFLSAQSAKKTNGEKSQISSRILSSSPILEAFGNAKTVYNHNSSRFGKFIQLYFSSEGEIVGGNISHYLLEKNRTVGQNPDERNYHIFYQLLIGLTDPLKSKLGITDPKDFRYVSEAGCVRDPNLEDKDDFKAVTTAFEVMGLSGETVEEILTILTGILYLGNVKFYADGGAQIEDRNPVEKVAQHLNLNMEQLTEGLTHNKRVMRGETFLSPLTVEQAETSRDSITMALYSQLFDWIIQRINNRIKAPKSVHSSIGVLDIFGFENFQINRFEQFNINFANEKLQQYFNKHIFSLEQLEYNQEGISWTDIDWCDNAGCIDLIERKMGVLSIIDEESRFPKGTDKSMLDKLHGANEKNEFYIKPKVAGTDFGIRHYAGHVVYNTIGFLEKNRGSFRDDLIQLLKDSKSDFIYDLFEGVKLSTEGGNRGKKKGNTVASQFKDSLSSLMQTLSASNPYFVRCVKPNAQKQSNDFRNEMMINQLRYSGMMQTVVIRKSGFPVRRLYSDFTARYYPLLASIYTQVAKDKCCLFLTKLERPKEWQAGKTKIFMKETLENTLEQERIAVLGKAAVMIQKHWRAVLARAMVKKRLARIVKIQSMIRAHIYRRHFLRTRQATLIFQRYIRGHLARQVVAEMWAEKCAQLEAEIAAQKEAFEARKREMERLRKEQQEQEAERIRIQMEEEEAARKREEEERRLRDEQEMKEAIIRVEELEQQRKLEEQRALQKQRLLEEEEEKRREEERVAAEAAAAELMDDEDALNEAEAEMLRHLDDLDEAIKDAAIDEDIDEWWDLDEDDEYPGSGDDTFSEFGDSGIGDEEISARPIHSGYLRVKDVGKLSRWKQKYCILQGDSLLIFNAKQDYLKSGWMRKKGGGKGTLSRRNWLPRFFVLQETMLTYYDTEGGEAKGQINLRHAIKILEHSLDKNRNNYIGIVTPERTFELIAEDEPEHKSWLRILREVNRTPDENLHLMKEEVNPRNAVASIELLELESCHRVEDKTENHVFCVITNDRVHYFSAEDSEEMFRWIDLLSPQDEDLKHSALRAGYVSLVKSKLIKRKVYMTLTEKGIEMYKRREGAGVGKISLHSLCVVSNPEERYGEFCFHVHVRKRSYLFGCKTYEDALNWTEEITDVILGKDQFQTRTEKLVVELRNLHSDEVDEIYRSNPILRYTKNPIMAPILALPYGPSSSTNPKRLQDAAVDMYKQFLMYEGTPTPVEFIEAVLGQLFETPHLIDELYCQLIKQTAYVKDVDNPQNLRYWMFLLCVLATFTPSRKVLRYLKFHVQRCTQRYSGTEMYKSAVYAEGLIAAGVKQREFVPSREEIKKIMFLKDMPAVVQCYGGWNCKIMVTPTLTARLAVARLLSGMGIKSKYNKYALFEKYGQVYKVIEDQTLIADVIAKFERKHEGEECCIFFKLFAVVEFNISRCDPLELVFLYELTCEQIQRGMFPSDKVSLAELAALRCQYLYGDYKPDKTYNVSDVYHVVIPKQERRASAGGTLRGLGTLGKGTIRKLKDLYIDNEREDELLAAEHEEKARNTINDFWKTKNGLSKGAAQQELLKIATRWLAFGYGIFDVELVDTRFREKELWLAVGHNDVAIYPREKSIPLEVYTYDSIVGFGATEENVFKITIEGQSPLEMGTQDFLEISRLMKTYISIMVRRKQQNR